MSNGYADITELQGRQIALVHMIMDENIQPDSVKDGWECFTIEKKVQVSNEPIRIIEKPERQFKRRYKKDLII